MARGVHTSERVTGQLLEKFKRVQASKTVINDCIRAALKSKLRVEVLLKILSRVAVAKGDPEQVAVIA